MKLAIGTVQFGQDYGISNLQGAVRHDEIKRILSTARNNHIKLIDSAQAYGNSEINLGKTDTSGFQLITKLMPGISKQEIKPSIEASLTRLNRQQIYGVLFHSFDDYQKDPDTLNILNEVKQQGIFEKTGFSLYYPEELEILFENQADFDLIQIPFNIFDQRFLPYFKILKEKGIKIHIRSVFLQGLAFIEPEKLGNHFAAYRSHFQNLHDLIKQSNYSIAETCLNFVNIQPEIEHIVIGVCSNDELKSNINSLNRTEAIDTNWFEKYRDFKIDDEEIILPFNWKQDD